jgi:PAS domain S-box-containing protein
MSIQNTDYIDFLTSILGSPKGVVIFALDKEYRYTFFSETHREVMKTIWGVEIDRGTNMLEVIRNDDDRAKAKINFDSAIEGNYFTRIEQYGDVAHLRSFYENRYGPVRDQHGDIIGVSVFVIDISQLKRTENELHQNERRVSSILEIVPELTFRINGEGRYLQILSNKTLTPTEYPKAGDLVFENLPAPVIDKYKISIKICLELQIIQAFDYALLKNGNTHLYEARLIPCNEKEILVLVRDITFHEKAESEFIKLSLIAKHTSNSVIITDANGKIEWVNEGFTRVTEYAPQEVYGKKPGEILQGKDTDRATVALIREKIRLWEPFKAEIVNYSKSGRRYWVHINGQPIFNEAGEVIKFFAIETDITERKLAEIKILEQNTRLTSVTENLTRKNEQLEEFTQIVSHNLRSPIGNISALVEHLNSTFDEADKLEIIEHLKHASASLMLTLQELNEVLKIKYAGHIEKDHVDLEKTFAKVRRMLMLQINEIDAKVTVDFTRARTVLYPSIYIESIFLNLLSNALKYHSPKRRPVIHVESWCENDTVYMKISDNGLGIDLVRHGHQVFKLRKTFHAHAESRGVGLFMIRNQIEAMGGEINISSEVEVGTTFLINFGINPNHGG